MPDVGQVDQWRDSARGKFGWILKLYLYNVSEFYNPNKKYQALDRKITKQKYTTKAQELLEFEMVYL